MPRATTLTSIPVLPVNFGRRCCSVQSVVGDLLALVFALSLFTVICATEARE